MKSRPHSIAASQQAPAPSLPTLNWVRAVVPALNRAARDLGVQVTYPSKSEHPKWAHLTPCPLCHGENDPHAVATIDLSWDKDAQELSLRLRCSDVYCKGYAKDGLEVEHWAPDYLWNRWVVPDAIPLGTLTVARTGLAHIVHTPANTRGPIPVEGVPMGVGKTRSTVDDIAAEVAAGGEVGPYLAPRHDQLAPVEQALRSQGVVPFLIEGSSRTVGPQAGPWAQVGVPARVIQPSDKTTRRRKRNQPVLAAHQVINKPAPWTSALRGETDWRAWKKRNDGKKFQLTPPVSLKGPVRIDEQLGFIRSFEITTEHLKLVLRPFTDPVVESWAKTRRAGIGLLLDVVVRPFVNDCCTHDQAVEAAGGKNHFYARDFDDAAIQRQVRRIPSHTVQDVCLATLPLLPPHVFRAAWDEVAPSRQSSQPGPTRSSGQPGLPREVLKLATHGWMFHAASMPFSPSLSLSTKPGDEWPSPAIDDLLRAVFAPGNLTRPVTVHLSIDATGAQPQSKFRLSYRLGDDLPDDLSGKVLDGTAPLGVPAYEAAFAPKEIVVNNYDVKPDYPAQVRRVLLQVGNTAFSRRSLLYPAGPGADLRPEAVVPLVRVVRAAANEIDRWVVPRIGGPAKLAWIVPKATRPVIDACVAAAWGRASSEQVARIRKCGADRLVEELKWHIKWGTLAEVRVGHEYAVHGSNAFEDCQAILTFRIRPNLGEVWRSAQVLAVNPVGLYGYLAESIVAQHEERIRVLSAFIGSPKLTLHASSSAPAWWGDEPFEVVETRTGQLAGPGRDKVVELYRDLLDAHGAVYAGLIDWIAAHPDAYLLAFGSGGQTLQREATRVSKLRRGNRHADLKTALARPGCLHTGESGLAPGQTRGAPQKWYLTRAGARAALVQMLEVALA